MTYLPRNIQRVNSCLKKIKKIMRWMVHFFIQQTAPVRTNPSLDKNTRTDSVIYCWRQFYMNYCNGQQSASHTHSWCMQGSQSLSSNPIKDAARLLTYSVLSTYISTYLPNSHELLKSRVLLFPVSTDCSKVLMRRTKMNSQHNLTWGMNRCEINFASG